MKIGISTWSLGKNTLEALNLISETEIKYIELWYYNDLTNSEKIISEFASSHNMVFWSLHAPFGKELDISHLDSSLRKLAVKEILKSMKIAYHYGCECLIIHPSSNFYDNVEQYENSKRSLIESLSELEHYALDLDIRILVENMLSKPGLYRVGILVKELREIIEEGGFEAVGICLDTGHSNYNGLSPSEEALIAGDLLGSIHLNDNDGTSDSHKVPGEGTINWEKFTEALRKLKYQNVIVLEVHGGMDPISVLRRSVNAVTRIFGF